MAERTEEGKQKKNILDRLPKLSRVSLLILFIGIFLLIIIPLILVQNTERAKQSDYRQEVQMLEKIVANPATQVATLEDDIRRAEANLANNRGKFPEESKNTSVIDDLVSLADKNNIDIVKLTSSIQDTTVNVGTKKLSYPSMGCVINVAGDSANIQKFLLAINQLQTCQIKNVIITMAISDTEVDTASFDLLLLLQD